MPWHVASGKLLSQARGSHTWLAVYTTLHTYIVERAPMRSVVKEADHTTWHVPRGLVSKSDDMFTDRIL